MNVGDPLRMFHRPGPYVADSTGKAITLPSHGWMEVSVTEVIKPGRVVNVSGVDALNETFVETGVTVLAREEQLPEGGRYALLPDDDSEHPPARKRVIQVRG